MNVEEHLDLAILKTLAANQTEFGLGPDALKHLVTMFGVTPDVEAIRKRLLYLADPHVGFVTKVDRGEFHPENATWRITARGLNHLRQNG